MSHKHTLVEGLPFVLPATEAASAAASLDFGGTTYPTAASLANGALLYNAAGTISGLVGSVQGSVPAWNAASSAFLDSARAWAIATTSTIAILLANTTAAIAGVPVQYSPALEFSGTAWDTTTSASCTEEWRCEVVPASGVSTSSQWILSWRKNSGAFSPYFRVGSIGLVDCLSQNGISIDAQYTTLARGDNASGLGTVTYLSTLRDYPMIFISKLRTDAASNIVFASVYDRNAASITNATMRLFSYGWTNDANAYTEVQAHYVNGDLWLGGGHSYSDDGSTATFGVTNGAGLNIKSLGAVITIAAAVTTTTTIQIPAGAVVLGCSCRVTTVIPDATSFALGHAGSTALFGTGILVAAGTTNTGACAPTLFAAATSLLFTFTGGPPGANTGRVRVCVHYYIPTAPTA